MKKVIDIINEAILDVCASPVSENGSFDSNNDEHIYYLMETLEKYLDDETIEEAVMALKAEGKYPDRQAYNKEGWLVTFPSKEYRDAAIKKGTHTIADPTHGKGGMNLYYKRRGKQKRVAQQAQSSTEPEQAPASPQKAPPVTEPGQAQKPAAEPAKETPQTAPPTEKPAETPSGQDKGGESSLPKSDAIDFASSYNKDPDALPPAPKPQEKTASPEPGEQTAEKAVERPYKDITEKFAKSKGWTPTPYGEWRDAAGAPAAVVSLSGEVTPIKSTDREELKLFADKQS